MARPKTILEPKVGRTFLPDAHVRAHELCFLLRDFMLELLRSAEQHGLFSERFDFRDETDRLAFEQADNVFQWFDSTDRINERAAFLRRTVFPGLLSDFLHFLFVALEASRRGNLTVAFALLRNPIQENLFLFEVIAADLSRFASEFAANPLLLRSQKAGGVQAHTARNSAVVNQLADDRFDAQYLCQLRYDKNAEDGFDGACNKAVHLVTEHAAIRTDKLNLNFIFPDGMRSSLSGPISIVGCHIFSPTRSDWLSTFSGQCTAIRRAAPGRSRPSLSPGHLRQAAICHPILASPMIPPRKRRRS